MVNNSDHMLSDVVERFVTHLSTRNNDYWQDTFYCDKPGTCTMTNLQSFPLQKRKAELSVCEARLQSMPALFRPGNRRFSS